ncbi:MAG TPA: proteasome accessory factor PafA2 family protein, partial [Chthoniobacterales bacterium]|nr:proteasome accessory factor PafA2 family protein [Chthoniobacterales bacterium]
FVRSCEPMNRIVGLETEYGCLISEDQAQSQADAWPVKVKNYLFRKCHVGAIDLHYRDYEEPPGNGGFLLNGGRLYLDMGHLEYSSPECLDLKDLVSFDIAGDLLLNRALKEMGVEGQVTFLKNNVDHHTGATFGCHENYLMRREAQFTPAVLASLLAFLATRQIFTGAGRVGQANPLAFDFELPDRPGHVNFQISQRADHIVNDIYQWVQFNRAIINARDEPLADYRKYRRLHLLIGDSNMSPFATALKVGTTVCVLTLLEENLLPTHIALRDAVLATREISRDPDGEWLVEMDDGTREGALDIQYQFLEHAHRHLSGQDEETDWILESWSFTLDAIRSKPELLIGGVDWISKRWLLNMFMEEEGLTWQDPWLQSLDLEYHNINSAKGLFFALKPPKAIGEFNAAVRREDATSSPPQNTRAKGRSLAVAQFQKRNLPYIVNWDSIALESQDYLPMPDPFNDYDDEVGYFLK